MVAVVLREAFIQKSPFPPLRLSDSCESGEAISFVHPPTPATGKLIHNLLCDCRVKND